MENYEKKYKDLEGKIKKAYLYAQTDSTKAVLEDILPELAESEDEKIRKSIIENLKGNMYRADGDYDLLNKQISWLEKQGKKTQGKSALEAIKEKPANNANKVEPKFKVKYAGREYNVLEIKESAGVKFYGIEDEANHIDYVLSDDCEIISGYGEKEKGSPYPTKSAIFSEQNPAWSEEDDAYQSFAISAVEDYYDAKNSIQRGLIDWLKSIKDRVQPQPKQELSESDEEEFQIAIDTLVEAGQRDSAHWLESIKDRVQPHWKPSEKQLDALQYVYRNCNPPLSDKLGWDSIRTLELMYQDLKKLREEVRNE